MEFPLYLWEPFDDLEAARFLPERKEEKKKKKRTLRAGEETELQRGGVKEFLTFSDGTWCAAYTGRPPPPPK